MFCLNTDCKLIFSPVPPLLEYPGCLPLRLRPHPQPHGQPDSCGSRNHIRQPFCPSDCCGCQQQSGTYHRLPGRLQRELTQGNIAHRVSGRAQTGRARILVLRKSILCQLWCSARLWWNAEKNSLSCSLFWLQTLNRSNMLGVLTVAHVQRSAQQTLSSRLPSGHLQTLAALCCQPRRSEIFVFTDRRATLGTAGVISAT